MRKGYVYRLYNSHGNLLYVGRTYKLTARFYWTGKKSHCETKVWWPQVTHAKIAVFKTEQSAISYELHTIHRESPLHNQQRPKPRTCRPPRPVLTYSGEIHTNYKQ